LLSGSKQSTSSPNASSTKGGKKASTTACPGKKSISVLTGCTCCDCGDIIGDDSKALQCERCVEETWKCSSCLGISDELYDELITSSKNCLHWFCSICEEYVFDNLSMNGEKIAETLSNLTDKTSGIEQHLNANFAKIEQQLMDRINVVEQLLERKASSDLVQWQSMEGRLQKLEEKPSIIEESQERIELKVDQLKNNMNEPMVQAVQGVLQGALQQDKEEEMEIERRKKNVIVHGVSESNADNPEQRVDEDLTLLAAMFHEVGVEEIKVENVVRLEKKNSDPAQHPRPMKVVLDTAEWKVQLLRKAKNLRLKQDGGWERVFIHQDLTPRQREARKPLVAELKQRKANGESNLIIFNGKVVQKRASQLIGTN